MGKIIRILAVLVLMTGLAASASAAPDDMERRPSNEQFEKVRQRIESLRMWRLTKALDLDDKTSAALFPLLNKYDKKRHEQERSLREGIRELRQASREGRDPVLKGLLDRLDQHHREIQRLNDEERAEVRKILTVKQRAAFVLFQQEFQQDIRRIISESRERRRDRRMPGSAEERPKSPFPFSGD